MSAQGATLGRGIVHLPIWPVAALVAAAAAVMIGMTLIDVRPETSVTPVTLNDRLANSSAALREQGGSVELGAVWGISHVTPAEATFAGFENPGAYVAPAPTYATGLENPGAYVVPVPAPTYATGLENPGAYQSTAISGKAEPHDPIVFDGNACPQCR